jgi:excisionase family DNA binding protein
MKIKWFKSLSTVTQHFWLSHKRKQWLKKLQHQNILTLSEAAFYLDIDPGTLVEEVASGHLPGGKLGGNWRFYKTALNEHFSVYHGPGPDYQYWLEGDEDSENNSNPICEEEIKTHLVFANENGLIELDERAIAFVRRAIETIKEKLNKDASFRLMPYRYQGNGAEFLGFDWSDKQGGSVSFTFWCDESEILLPDPVIPNSNDVIVPDWVDALHLIRAIAVGVLGNSKGEI